MQNEKRSGKARRRKHHREGQNGSAASFAWRVEPRRTQLDLRLTKFVGLTRGRVQINFDVYNALNASNVVTLNTNYGPSWLQPTSFLTGRLYEIGGSWSF